MAPTKSLFHLFKTHQAHYLYDAFSNRIYLIDLPTYTRIQRGNSQDILHLSHILRDCKSDTDPKSGIKDHDISIRPGFSHPMHALELTEALKSTMQYLLLEATEICPLRCKYCVYSGTYTNQRKHSSKSMSFHTAIKAIDLFVAHSSKSIEKRTIGFYGGEPLVMYELIKECVTYVKKQVTDLSIRFAITTNGILLTPDKFDFLIDHDVFLYISLDGPKDYHDRYRVSISGGGTFNKIEANLKKLKQFNPSYYNERVSFLCVVSDYNEFTQISDFFENNPLTSNHYVSFSPIGYLNLDDSCKSPVKTIFSRKSLREMQDKYCETVCHFNSKGILRFSFDKLIGRIHNRAIMNLSDSTYPNGICIPGVRKLFVRTDGSFYPCERVDNTYKIGSIEDGIQSNKVIDLVSNYCRLCNQTCKSCWARRLCHTCFTHVKIDGGAQSKMTREDNTCKNIQAEIHDALVMYARIMEANPQALDNILCP